MSFSQDISLGYLARFDNRLFKNSFQVIILHELAIIFFLSETSTSLPSGETIDVAAGYKSFMRYYTTSNMTGSQATDLGYKLINRYYSEVYLIFMYI